MQLNYLCAVVCLGVLCLLLAIFIRVLWLKTTSEISQIQAEHNNQLELFQKTIKNFTEVTQVVAASLKDLLRYKKLAEEKDHLQLQCNLTEEQLRTKFSAEREELQRLHGDPESHDMTNIKQHAVDVTLDPDTAHPQLILSADGKQVKHEDTYQNLPDTPKRFNQINNVLGREGFSSGKFYYEVQVKGKTGWIIGVAKESINRKGSMSARPEYGLWTIWLKDGTYKALDSPRLTLSLKGKPQSVGVSVDYDAGLVSFYDADCWDHIYSFTHVTFTEKIYPFFSPFHNEKGTNSAPLIISPVDVCPIE